MFLVRGIVDNTNEITNKKVILTSVQNVKLESSNSPNETVIYRSNFKLNHNINTILTRIRFY